MRDYGAVTNAALTATEGRIARLLVWVTAMNRSTGLPETLGFWNGVDDATFTIGGVSRLYLGGGSMMRLSPLIYRKGLSVQTQELIVSPLAPVVVAAARTYDLRFAPIEIHRALFNIGSPTLVAEPHRMFKGTVDAAPITVPEAGGEAVCTMTLMTTARALTRTIPLFKSDETQQRRGGDRARRYIDTTGVVDTPWGTKRAN